MSNFKIGLTVIYKGGGDNSTAGNSKQKARFVKGNEYIIREIGECGGLRFLNIEDPTDANSYWDENYFELPANSLSMQFTAKLKKDREELILLN